MTSHERLAFVDALKALASQFIVVHHLAFYGPMSDYAQSLSPGLISWLYDYARIAVQAFLVMGGFLGAQALAPDGLWKGKPVAALIWRRYLKLALPYFGALLLAIGAASIARNLMINDATPEFPTIQQLVAHVFLLQSILGFDGLSAGVWYVAIDFQLYALLVISLWLARSAFPSVMNAERILVSAVTIVSLYYFNRDDAFDNWGVYFFGAYGLGALTHWAVQRKECANWSALILALAAGALIIDYRLRVAVALSTAVTLGIARYFGIMKSWPHSKLITWLGKISYSVFLAHYPICLVVNALFERFVPHSPDLQATGMVVAWVASIAGGAVFYRLVESRAQFLLANRKPSLKTAS